MPDLPTGTVTFLLTDIEGSTNLWERYPEVMRNVIARHDVLAADIVAQHEGVLIKSRGEGDSLFIVFARATDATAATCRLEQALLAEPWPVETRIRVRSALHTGEADLWNGDYYGSAVNRCARLRAIGHGGQILLSQTTFDLVRDSLPPQANLLDLGEHRLRDLQRPEHVFQLLHPSLPADFPPLKSLDACPNNLPLQLTSFVGREREMEDIKRWLSSTRLLTLTGSGGSGKTRLALQVAADVLDAYPDGVWFAELAPLSDPSLVPQTVASALTVQEEPNQPIIRTLCSYLQKKTLLLVLDNCEHLLAACARLADTLLRTCPSLRILTTSREGLGITGELTYRVPSLTLPDSRQVPTVESLTQYEAVRLFIQRAVFSRPDFAVTRRNAPALAAICHRLDGIPLAIELAAAWVKVLPVEQIAARLDDRFRLLIGGSRTALPRQQTLRATIDWSYDLLIEPERLLLKRLSIFVGGWTLTASEAVCTGEGIEVGTLLELLTSLLNKSLALYEEHGEEARYNLLETVRQYSRTRLRENRENEELLCRRHRDFFLAFAEEAYHNMRGPDQVHWLERMERDHDNFRAALRYCLEDQDSAEAGLRLAGALGWFWLVRGHLSEGRMHLAAALARAEPLGGTAARGKALSLAGSLADAQDDYAAAVAFFEQSLSIYRAQNDRKRVAGVLSNLGNATASRGDIAAARAFYEQSLAIYREMNDRLGIAITVHNLGARAYEEGDLATARRLYEESLTWEREMGNVRGVAFSLADLGLVALDQGDHDAARALLEESLALRRQLDDKWGIANSLASLGLVMHSEGDYAAARALHAESLTLKQAIGNRKGIAFSLESFAYLAQAEGRPEQAARLLGAAEALREALHTPLPPNERAHYDAVAIAAQKTLTEEAFAAAWSQGRKMSQAQAVKYALEENP